MYCNKTEFSFFLLCLGGIMGLLFGNLTVWSDLPDLKNREGGRKDGTEDGSSREIYQRTREMEF